MVWKAANSTPTFHQLLFISVKIFEKHILKNSVVFVRKDFNDSSYIFCLMKKSISWSSPWYEVFFAMTSRTRDYLYLNVASSPTLVFSNKQDLFDVIRDIGYIIISALGIKDFKRTKQIGRKNYFHWSYTKIQMVSLPYSFKIKEKTPEKLSEIWHSCYGNKVREIKGQKNVWKSYDISSVSSST